MFRIILSSIDNALKGVMCQAASWDSHEKKRESGKGSRNNSSSPGATEEEEGDQLS